MKKICLSALLIFCFAKTNGGIPVADLKGTPAIDGRREVQFGDVALAPFPVVEKSDPANESIPAGWLLAANADHLYLYIEAQADSLVVRDRGYQNGDGFHLMVGKPQPGMAPTDEFHVLGFAAADPGAWYRKIRWYYNVGLSFDRLGDRVRFATQARDGRISFELLLPWSEVYPWHPALSDSVGLNLCFVKAIGRSEANYYYLKFDERFQWEQSLREYELLEFAAPQPSSDWQLLSILLKNRLAGGVNFLPPFDAQALRETIRENAASRREGSVHTLLFYVDRIEQERRALKPYEFSPGLREEQARLERYLRSGDDLLATQTGTYRRAYADAGELRPYTIHLPADYAPGKKYPLLVFLHGSGQDDRALQGAFKPEGMIVVAPNGRDVSNCFATPEAQADIERAIDDCIANFPIDTTRILLSGFSMGGYGVYRTFYENPARYRALAILSGHPGLAAQWMGDEKWAVDFLEPKNLCTFRGLSIFVYHGKNDLNCPYNLTEQVVGRLRANGNRVEFASDERGHDALSAAIEQRYADWLRRQIEP